MSEDVFHLGIKGLIRNDAGEILLLQVSPDTVDGRDYWDLPGGRIQEGSTIEETLQREIEEETGISQISDVQPVGMVLANIRIPRRDNSGASFGLILGVYRCCIPLGATITLSSEHIAYRWVTPTQAATLLAEKYPADFCRMISALANLAVG